MSVENDPPVRPTKRVLEQLGIAVPHLRAQLHELDDPTISEAQRFPEVHAANGLKRFVNLKDRVWFKSRTDAFRFAATQLRSDEVDERVLEKDVDFRWWIGAAGPRQGDSQHRDFYQVVEKEAVRECRSLPSDHPAKKDGTFTGHLLPREWDWKRLAAERGELWKAQLQDMVVDLISQSLQSHQVVQAEFAHHYLRVWVNAPSRDEAYLVIGAEGIPDPKVIALVLSAVPGIAPDEWAPEPSPERGFNPSEGEILWSAVLPPDAAAQILDAADRARD